MRANAAIHVGREDANSWTGGACVVDLNTRSLNQWIITMRPMVTRGRVLLGHAFVVIPSIDVYAMKAHLRSKGT